jgi:hypothetical protein
MFVSVAIMAHAKILLDRSKLELFQVLERQGEQIVTEKVLRCEAEFAKEAMVSTVVERHGLLTEHLIADKIVDTGSLGPSHVESAPAILASLASKDVDACVQGVGDCLPLHARVWTEGAKLPAVLHQVTGFCAMTILRKA